MTVPYDHFAIFLKSHLAGGPSGHPGSGLRPDPGWLGLILFQNAETREGSNGVGLVEVIVTIGIRGIEITWLKIA